MNSKRLCEKLPYRGITNWALIWSISFIIAQTLWHFSRFVRSFDFLEIPMVIFYFPLAPLFDPYDGMLHDENLFVYAISYWLSVFIMSLFLSRKKINPLVPAVILLILSCMTSGGYALYLWWRGPIYMP